MKIYTYNVNGIRSAINKGLNEWIFSEKPDILCFQELKANPDQVELDVLRKAGYSIYWNPAIKKGYSGVATFSKIQPDNVEVGSGNRIYDDEGRFLRLDFRQFSLLNVYIPSGSSGDERQLFKMEFLNFFSKYIKKLLRNFPSLVVCGDFNICHRPIDIHNPVSNKNSSGFLPEEREWLSDFLNLGFIDTFRLFNDQPHHYTWWTFRANARARNLGWRIDYIMASEKLRDRLQRATILPAVNHSDHCPAMLEIL